ncbi:transporter substrate-binding domain-containing protein [Terasakiella sp. SH-1]|uniref:substrate-binding periplasmic protein n=1 Tax=Terasakiella sp. SH-1 TaxID=2560057 RepID=UPI0010741FB3|nr:transporter substrate-binding domain-containing protein [Terasakiella sp. SH-1]
MSPFIRLLVLGLFLCLPRAVMAQPPEVLRLVANEWEPYTGANILNKGLASDIVATALRRAGYDVNLQIVPWTRALKGVESGNYHGIIAAWYSKERERHMAFGRPYLTNDLVLFKRSIDKIPYVKLMDLQPYTIGVVRDYAYGDEFDGSAQLKKKPALDLRTNLVRLSNHLIDLFPEDRFVVKHLLNSKYPEYSGKIDFLDKPLSQRTLHMTISKKTMGYDKIVADFNRELQAMKAEGLLEKLIEKHNLNF